jgi:hypothetical protein
VSAELEISLIAAYHKTLKFLLEAINYFDGNSLSMSKLSKIRIMLKKYLENTFKSWLGSESKFKYMIEDVKAGMNEVTGWTRLANRECKLKIPTLTLF